MKIGLCIPYMKRNYARQQILNWCRRIDQGPFDMLSCGERIVGYSSDMRILMAAAAAVTERVRLVPSLYVLPMHSAVRAAKEIATLDLLSGGRVDVTVGVGGRREDYRAVGASFDRRHQKMDEQVAVMRDIWRGVPPFEGCDPVGPNPVQPGGPPLLIGAMGPKSMRRGAAWADGVYVFSMNAERDEIRSMLDTADRAWQDAGRSDPPRKMAGFWYSLAADAETQLKEYVFEYMRIFGEKFARQLAQTACLHNRDAVLRAVDDMQQVGCEELFLVPATADYAEIDGVEAILAER